MFQLFAYFLSNTVQAPPSFRRYERRAVEIPIRVRGCIDSHSNVEPLNLQGRTINLSDQGALLEIDEAVEASHLYVCLDTDDTRAMRCRIAHQSSDTQTGKFYVGVEFEELVSSLVFDDSFIDG